MRVQKVHLNAGYEVALLDDEGLAIPIVSNFLGYLSARGCSPNTLCAYAHDLQHFYQFLSGASIQIQEFTPRRTLDFLQYLRAVANRGKTRKLPAGIDCGAAPQSIPQFAPTTVNRILAAVSTFYEYIILNEVDSNSENPLRKIPDLATARVVPRYKPFLSLTTKQRPVRRVVRVRTAQRLPRPLADEQVAKLFSSFTRRRDKAIFLLMLQGGLRPGEVLNLHLEDVQYGRRRVIVRYRTDHPKGVRTKSSVERVVDLHEPETLAAISAYTLHERPSDTASSHLFLVSGSGRKRHEPLSYAALVKLFRGHCERLGFHERWVTPHALRHTHATKMWESGMRELSLQKRLGHASPESIRMYTRVSDAAMLEDYHRALKRAEKDGKQ
jgi:site-specific recombinase XerD